MTRQGWAERKVERKLGGQHTPLSPKLTAELLLAEHRRAVRAVKRLEKAAYLDQHSRTQVERLGYTKACDDILKALTKGRR